MEKRRRSLLKASAVIIALLFLAIAFHWYFSPEKVTGTVEHKSITGIIGNTQYTLVTFTSHGLNIDPLVSDLFSEMDANMTVSAAIEKKLEDRGYEVRYIGYIGLNSSDEYNGLTIGETNGYFLKSRDDFNRMELGRNVVVEVSHAQKNTIHRVL